MKRRLVLFIRWFNWKLFFSVGFCVLVLMAYQERDSAKETIEYYQAKERMDAVERKEAAEERKEAARERQVIRDSQVELNNRYNTLATSYNNLINYFQARGTYIPPELIDGQLGRIEIERNNYGDNDSNEHSSSSNSDRVDRPTIPPKVDKGGGGGGNNNSDQRPDKGKSEDHRRDDKASRGSNEKSNGRN